MRSAGLLAIACTDVAYAQRRVVVRMPPVTVAPPPTTKLAPPLQAAVAADARFTGTSRDGDPVLDIPAGRSTEDVIAAIRKVTPVVSIEDIATPEVTRIDQLIVLFDGGLPPERNTLAGLSVSTRNRSGGWITVRSAEGFTASQLSAIAETPGVRFAEPDYRYWLLQAPASNDPDLRRQWGMERIGAPRV